MSENDANSNTHEATAKADEAAEGSSRLPSRRQFLLSAAPAAAAAAGAAAFAPGKLMAQGAPSIPSIKIPKELGESMSEAPFVGKFEGNGMTGAEIFAQLCVKENLAAMFCCPGNYTVTHAVAAAGIPSYGGRTEGSMAAAADGYSRATGEGIDAAPAAEQTETGFDAGRVAPRVQADRQSAVIVDAASEIYWFARSAAAVAMYFE